MLMPPPYIGDPCPGARFRTTPPPFNVFWFCPCVTRMPLSVHVCAAVGVVYLKLSRVFSKALSLWRTVVLRLGTPHRGPRVDCYRVIFVTLLRKHERPRKQVQQQLGASFRNIRFRPSLSSRIFRIRHRASWATAVRGAEWHPPLRCACSVFSCCFLEPEPIFGTETSFWTHTQYCDPDCTPVL